MNRSFLLLLGVGCAVPEEPPETERADIIGTGSLRFERLARVDHDGSGVFPVWNGASWMKTGGQLVLADTDGSEVERIDVPLGDFELLYAADDQFWVQSEDGGLFTVGDDDVVPVDDVPLPPPAVPIETPRPSIDVASSVTGTVGLDTDQVMYHFDPETGEVLAEWRIRRPTDIYALEFSNDGSTLVAIAPDSVVFFSFDPEGRGYDLYEYEISGEVPPDDGGGASGGGGGSGGGNGTYEPSAPYEPCN